MPLRPGRPRNLDTFWGPSCGSQVFVMEVHMRHEPAVGPRLPSGDLLCGLAFAVAAQAMK